MGVILIRSIVPVAILSSVCRGTFSIGDGFPDFEGDW
jgi:hypothetical protein